MAEINLFGVVGYDIDLKEFKKELDSAIKDDPENVIVNINSPGGYISDGLAIYHFLKESRASVTTRIKGVAASIASIIALAGDKVEMSSNALMMIHEAWIPFVSGTSRDLRSIADTLDSQQKELVNIYQKASGADEGTITAALEKETWFNIEDAQTFGFNFSETETSEAVNLSRFDLSSFKNVPAVAKARFCSKFGECGLNIDNQEPEQIAPHQESEEIEYIDTSSTTRNLQLQEQRLALLKIK